MAFLEQLLGLEVQQEMDRKIFSLAGWEEAAEQAASFEGLATQVHPTAQQLRL